jgi:hypothetical protein
MNEQSEVKEQYLAAYSAFEQGDFTTAGKGADSCLKMCSPASYWYAGALGLKCWLASFCSAPAELDVVAKRLLTIDTGPDKFWFEGIALLNLGLMKCNEQDMVEARRQFSRAAECYNKHPLHPGQPREWQKVTDYFSTLCRWAAAEDNDKKKEVLNRFRSEINEENELLRHLSTAIQLMIRYTDGEDVKQEARACISTGVSRTFLAFILLDCKD